MLNGSATNNAGNEVNWSTFSDDIIFVVIVVDRPVSFYWLRGKAAGQYIGKYLIRPVDWIRTSSSLHRDVIKPLHYTMISRRGPQEKMSFARSKSFRLPQKSGPVFFLYNTATFEERLSFRERYCWPYRLESGECWWWWWIFHFDGRWSYSRRVSRWYVAGCLLFGFLPSRERRS